MSVAGPAESLRDGLRALERAYTLGHHGPAAARRRAALVDACLAELFDHAGSPARVALIATGGYGRMVQLPASDIDLLVVHDDPASIAETVDALLYPLWDAGLPLGHAVRTAAECLAATERLDAWTAMLDGRIVVGDETLAVGALAPVRARAREDPAWFARRLRDAAGARRDRFGSSAQLLEPDLKEGSGGLRDAASLGWLATALGTDLESAGVVRARERAAVDTAEAFLIRARSAVQLLTGRRADRLVTELQPDVARGMGFVDEPDLLATDGLMRSLFEHARNVEHVAGLAMARVMAGATGAGSVDAGDPAAILEALADVADQDQVPSAGLLDAIEDVTVPDRVAWDARTRAAFLRLLRAGERGSAMFDVLDRMGLLARFIPAWAEVRCRPQRDPYHRSTVDAHLVAAAAQMADLLAGSGDAGDPLEVAAVTHVERPDALLLGALLHDVGKIGAGGHVPIGTTIARDTLDAMGVAVADRDLAVFLVQEHLLLPDTATRRDLSDEDLLLDVAARIGSPERLGALYLLAKADAFATGPAAWTPWRETLVRELVAKVQRVFDRGEMGEELAAHLAARTERLRELLEGEPEDLIDRFILRVPRAYLLAVDPGRAAEHFRIVMPPLGRNEVRTAATVGSRAGTYEVVVVASDRPGLLSWIAGALAIGGISILAAQAFTTEDRTAVDVFEVEGAFEPEITEARWRAFRSTLRRTIEGSISLEHRVREKSRHYPPPRAPSPVSVRVLNDVSEFSTVIEVGAPDRIGLLHDITRTFADLHLGVHLAKVATFDGRVVDAFYVRDELGRKVTEPGMLADVEATLRERLEA
ncbi:MAG: ACT domain-containing protein [Actinobacteria bacterium]|nr:MAG: ACT domain-containing protein [Actinomycetota bacterium]